MKIIMKAVVVSLLILSSFYANAEITIKQYKKFQNEDAIKFYVKGLGVAYSWANVEMDANGKKPLYCQPPKLALGMDNYLRLLDDAIVEYSPKDDDVIEYLLLMQLKKVFPCK